MAAKMRLFHRRQSSFKDKSGNEQPMNMSTPVNPRLQTFGPTGHRCSLGSLGTPSQTQRPRSVSLFPGSAASHCLNVPQRTRSGSFSGDLGIRSSISSVHPTLTASEEEHIFRCYARVMYMMLGMIGAAVFGLVLYALHHTIVVPSFNFS